jgi:hypothetical protein
MNSIPSGRETWLIAGGFAAGLVAAVALAVIGLEPLVRATGHWFDASFEAQPVAVGEQAVLFEGGTQIGRLDPGLIAIRSVSREKFDDYELRISIAGDFSPRLQPARRSPPFVTARPASPPPLDGK